MRFSHEQEEEFRIELREVFYRYHGAAIGEIDPIQVIREAFTLIARMHLRIPTRFALLDKTLATLGGVGAELYPDFNVFEVAEPYARDLVASELSPRALFDRGREERRTYGAILMDLPYQVHDTIEQFRDGEIELKFRHRGLEEMTSKADAVFNRLALAIVIAGAFIGSGLVGDRGRQRPGGVRRQDRRLDRLPGSARRRRHPGALDPAQRPPVKTGSDPVFTAHVLACNKGV